jgi:hypothetical protein
MKTFEQGPFHLDLPSGLGKLFYQTPCMDSFALNLNNIHDNIVGLVSADINFGCGSLIYSGLWELGMRSGRGLGLWSIESGVDWVLGSTQRQWWFQGSWSKNRPNGKGTHVLEEVLLTPQDLTEEASHHQSRMDEEFASEIGISGRKFVRNLTVCEGDFLDGLQHGFGACERLLRLESRLNLEERYFTKQLEAYRGRYDY